MPFKTWCASFIHRAIFNEKPTIKSPIFLLICLFACSCHSQNFFDNYIKVNIHPDYKLPYVEASLNNQPLKFFLDSGGNFDCVLSPSLIKKVRATPTEKFTRYSDINGPIKVRREYKGSLSLGGLPPQDVNIVEDDNVGISIGEKHEDSLNIGTAYIGLRFLKNYNLFLNLGHQQLVLLPKTHHPHLKMEENGFNYHY